MKPPRPTEVHKDFRLPVLLRACRVGGTWSRDVSRYLVPALQDGVGVRPGEGGNPQTRPRKPAKSVDLERTRRYDLTVRWRKEFRSRGRLVEGAWAAVHAALVAAHPDLGRADMSTRAGRDRIWAWRRLAVWMVRWIDRDPRDMVRGWKQLAATFREASIMQKPYDWAAAPAGFPKRLRPVLAGVRLTPPVLDQLSYIGRALPQGDAWVQRKALDDHRECLSSAPRPLANHVLAAARDFARSWASRHVRPSGRISHPKVLESATIQEPRRSGGVAAHLCKQGFDLPPFEGLTDELRDQIRAMGESAPSDCDLEAIGRSTAFRDWALGQLCCPDASPPRSRVEAIPERGFKARVVTVPDLPESILGSALRCYLLPALRRTPECADVLSGKEELAAMRIASSRRPIEGDWIVSSDLTAASDTLSFELLQALVDGLEESGTLPPWAIRALKVLVGPQELVYPDGSVLVTRRGTLMGLGHTWSILSLSHLFWLDWAHRSVDPRVADVVRRTAAVCGDDLVVRAPLKWVQSYHQIAEASGARFSTGKHFVAKRRYVFLERIWSLKSSLQRVRLPRERTRRAGRWVREFPPLGARPVKVRPTVVRSIPSRSVPSTAIPLAGLTAGEVDCHFGPVRNLVLPNWVRLGMAVETLLHSPEAARKVRKVVRALYPGLPRWMRRHGVQPYLPRFLGGGGLLPPGRNVTRIGRLPRPVAKAVTTWVYGRSPRENLSLAKIYLPTTRRITNYAVGEQHTAVRFQQVSAVLCRAGKKPFDGHGRRLGTLSEAPEAAALAIARELSMVLLPEPSEERAYRRLLRPSQVGQTFRRLVLRANRRWPGSKPICPRAPRRALLARCKAVEEGFVWWANPRLLTQFGFGGWGLEPAAQRVVKDALGWSTFRPTPGRGTH
ncbi:RNA-dependent RNA polymerase [Wuhan insect virus 18]|uniref:RNA-dependent RNA polymerase n=1 Tax=Wuhan insect virus 18 TaxID=1923722 RepID=UPI00090CCF3B|nr:RNA-dependent RNA polymerase [Wuhan insect virus 18]APG77101.1 RNA-dependent RNA polymerase [Wuhan insect virus 18]